MTLRSRLAALSAIIAEEAERNSAFRQRLEQAFSLPPPDHSEPRPDAAREPRSRDSRAVTDISRKRGRRNPAVLDLMALARQGEEDLRRGLSPLDIEQLRDIVAQYGMDPGKLVMKWKDRDRIIDRIVELSLARSTKGDAFRGDKPPAPLPGGDEDVSQTS